MKKFLLETAYPQANANAASKIYVCATPQNSALAQVDYEALSWVEVGGVGSRGEMGKITNVLNYDTWNDSVIQKAKGMTNAGDVDLEVARDPSDAGQTVLRSAAAVGHNENYAFKEVRADGTGGNVGTVIYNRGLVVGLRRPGGRNEDFDLEVFTLALQQEEIVVNPLDGGNPPVNTVAPAITGTAEVGETLSVNNGTFTGDATITYSYQWYAGGSAISGATSSTIDLTSTQLGKIITARVTAVNGAGTAFAFSAPTSAVANP